MASKYIYIYIYSKCVCLVYLWETGLKGRKGVRVFALSVFRIFNSRASSLHRGDDKAQLCFAFLSLSFVSSPLLPYVMPEAFKSTCSGKVII